MPVNEVIHKNRKKIGLTQEQVAQYLGVSTPAVNKWEKGVTYPDINLLPPLARLLQIDINTLLCFHEEMSKQEVNLFAKEIVDTIKENGYECGFLLGMNKVKEYPACYQLIHTTALTLEGSLMLYGTEMKDKELYINQINDLYERVTESDDEEVRSSAAYMLTSKYIHNKDFEKAQKMLDLIPDKRGADKKPLEAKLLVEQDKLGEASKLLEQKLLLSIQEIMMVMMNLAEIAIKEKDDERALKIAEIYKQINKEFDLWQYSSFVIDLQIAVKQKNISKSISLLESMLNALLTPWDMQHSVVFSHLYAQDKSTEAVNLGKQMLSALIADLETNADFDFLRNHRRFEEIIRQYRTKC